MTSRSNASASSWPTARRCAALLALLLVAAAAEPAWAAKKKIVVLGFRGPKAARVQRGVVKLLKPNATVVSGKVFASAARQVDGYRPDPEGVGKVARLLKAHGILTGKLTQRGRKVDLTLQLLEGRNGQTYGDPIMVTLRRGRLDSAARRKLERELRAALKELPDPTQESALDEVAAIPKEEPTPAIEPPPPPRRRGRRERKRPRRVASAEVASQTDGGRDQEGAVSKPAGEGADQDDRARALDLVAGVSFVSRKLTFSVEDGLQDLPQGYSGALVPGVYAAAEVYPVALANRNGQSFARNIGLSLKVDKVLLIKSELPGETGADSLPTSQLRYGGGLVYRWNFGSSPASPTLKVGAGYNVLSFTIDESEAEDPDAIELPDVTYTYIDPGLGLRLPIGERFAVLAEAHYLYVLDSGQMEDDDQYGSSSIVAFDADLGAEFKITSTFLARAGARFAQVGMSFDGDGDLTDRTNDGMQDVNSASDRFLGFYATAGLLF